MQVSHHEDLVRKSAQTDSDRRRLASEAAILRTAAHPGVVELVAVDNPGHPDAIVLRRVDGRTLAEQSPVPPEALSWTGAALATTVADLHDIGVVHLALEPSHVIIDGVGRPVLCGFGQARRLASGQELESCKQRDVTSLARMLIEVAENLSATPGASALRISAGGRRSPWTTRRADARSLARALAGARPTTAPRHIRRKRPLAVTAMIAVAALAVGMRAEQTIGRSSAAPGSIAQACPGVDDGCRVIPADQQATLGRFRIRGVNGATVLGRWDCRGDATPAVLDGHTGRLWVFDAWPDSGRAATGRLAATVPGAYAPVVVPTPGSPACDSIELSRRGGHPLLVTVRRP